jgi:hypothetical protein
VSDWLTEANRRMGEEQKAERLVVYVAVPYSAPQYWERQRHLHQALEAGVRVMELGHVPLVPHLSHYIDQEARRTFGREFSYEEWMEQCFALLERCDALLFLGRSPGADREWMHAKILQIPAYASIEELRNGRQMTRLEAAGDARKSKGEG